MTQPPPLASNFCSQCGARIKAEANFCHACGTPVQKPPRVGVPPPLPPEAALPPAPQPSTPPPLPIEPALRREGNMQGTKQMSGSKCLRCGKQMSMWRFGDSFASGVCGDCIAVEKSRRANDPVEIQKKQLLWIRFVGVVVAIVFFIWVIAQCQRSG